MQRVHSTPIDESSESVVAEAQVIRTPTGYGAEMIEGPASGRWWALEGYWTPGQQLRVCYAAADQFCRPVEVER